MHFKNQRLFVGILLFWIATVVPSNLSAADETEAIAAIYFFRGRVRTQDLKGKIPGRGAGGAGIIEDGHRTVSISYSDLTDSNVIPRLAELTHLHHLTLGECQFHTHELASLVVHKATMTSLYLYDTPTDDEALKHIGKLTELKMLNLYRTKVTGAGIAHLSALQKLSYLATDSNDIEDDSVQHFAKLKGLRELEIMGQHKLTDERKKKLRAALPDCKIFFGSIQEEDKTILLKNGLPAFTAAQAIRNVGGHLLHRDDEVQAFSVSDSDLTKNNILADTINLPYLRCVILNHCQFDPSELRHLATVKDNLTDLFLYDTSTDDDSLKHIGKMDHLELLGLSRTKITSAGVAHLTDLPKLRYLSLGGTKVGDDAIPHLSKMKTLKKLDVVGETGFTAEGKKKLQAALPDCAISFRPNLKKP